MGGGEFCMTLGERKDRPRQPRRQDRAEFLDAGFEEFRDGERLIRLDAHLRGDAGKPRRIDLGLRHADHVLIGHAHGEMPRGFRKQLSVGAGLGIGIADRPEAIEIKPRIGEVLIGGEPAHAFGHERARRIGHTRDLVFQIGERRSRRLVALRRIGAQMRAAARRVEAGAEAAQIGVDRLAVGADRRFERLRRDRQRAGAGDGRRASPH